MIMTYILLSLGIFLLYKGADYLIKGVISLGIKVKISNAFLGLVVVGFGTSLPELLVSVDSALNNHLDIAYGNIIGSNILNAFIILACAILIGKLVIKQLNKIDIVCLVVSNILFIIMFIFFSINVLTSTILLIFTLIMLTLSYKSNKKSFEDEIDEISTNNIVSNYVVISGYIILGFMALAFGATLLVDNSVLLARRWEISEKVIGITLVALGTSLPELASSIVASIKKHNEIAVYNIIGSNIFNVTIIPAMAGFIRTFSGGSAYILDAIFYILALVVILYVVFRYKNVPVPKFNGVILLAVYILYTIILFYR